MKKKPATMPRTGVHPVARHRLPAATGGWISMPAPPPIDDEPQPWPPTDPLL